MRMALDHLVEYFPGLLVQDVGDVVQQCAQYGPPDAHELETRLWGALAHAEPELQVHAARGLEVVHRV